MCGIAGIQLKASGQVQEEWLRSMGEKQRHRGPDDFSIFIKGNVGFAHNRLSILDLSAAGNQPFRNERYVLTYNGEIYNYQELQEELIKEGVRFKSTCDTEVLFYYLIRHGVLKTLQSIKGMFAFSFCDLEDGTVYLCRDRLGIKPLYWKYDSSGLYWASEVKAMMGVTKIEPDPVKTLFSMASIADHSNFYTVFREVLRVVPGHYLACKPGEPPQDVEYYDINQEVDESYYRELDQLPFPEVCRLFNRLLQTSVRQMLMSDAPMGVFISGGVDSSLIAALAVGSKKEISLFTADVTGKHSEYQDTKALSERLGNPLHAFHFLPEMMLSKWAVATWFYGAPLITHTNSIPFSCVAALAREKGVKAVLTGEGSDELFIGYPLAIMKTFRPFLTETLDSFRKALSVCFPVLRRPSSQGARSMNAFLNLLVQDFERQRLREKGVQSYAFLSSDRAAESHYLSIQMIREGLIALLHRNDRMGMMASIESRFPFLDEPILHFAVNLPLKMKQRWGLKIYDPKHPFLVDKAIVRQTALDYLPEKMAFKRKSGFAMYGHKNIHVKPGYFSGGYAADLLRMTPEAEAHMLRMQDPYFIAKLVSVDIFGRIFSYRESTEQVQERISRFLTLHAG